MSIAISYLYNTKEQGVQTYLVNRLFTFPDNDVDFYIPQLLNMYIYIKDIADLLNPYFRYRCCNSVDFSLRCAWLLESFINDNKKESRKVSYAIKLHKLIVSDRLKPATDTFLGVNKTCQNSALNIHSGSNGSKYRITGAVKEESSTLNNNEQLVQQNEQQGSASVHHHNHHHHHHHSRHHHYQHRQLKQGWTSNT